MLETVDEERGVQVFPGVERLRHRYDPHTMSLHQHALSRKGTAVLADDCGGGVVHLLVREMVDGPHPGQLFLKRQLS